jgi:fructose-bisphosphate aldolase / 6-deoxy-5-ketofructose 1-phosphate synthase
MSDSMIPLNVSSKKQKEYLKNLKIATLGTGKLFIFAGDQKAEHLNDDFYGKNISPDDAYPSHLFNIASEVKGAVLATQLGLIASYANDYPDIPYIVKINSKTNLNKNKGEDLSTAWLDLEQVLEFKEDSQVNIVGIGYTIYLGSKYEHIMLKEAAQLCFKAHQNGLLAIIWAYPRNEWIKNETNSHLIAGASGLAACLGADFVKVSYPYNLKNHKKTAEDFQEVTKAAGKTKVICVGGSYKESDIYLKHLENQIKISQTQGVAIGRNIHQRPLKEAISLGKAISSIVHYGYSAENAKKVLMDKKSLPQKKKNNNNLFSFF